MNDNAPHARAFDLPGWPCPSRVRDIATTAGSWGWVYVGAAYTSSAGGGVFHDELGYLWADGDKTPKMCPPLPGDLSPVACLFWTDSGLGLYLPKAYYRQLSEISRLEMPADRYLPVATVAEQPPEFARE